MNRGSFVKVIVRSSQTEFNTELEKHLVEGWELVKPIEFHPLVADGGGLIRSEAQIFCCAVLRRWRDVSDPTRG